MPLQLPNLDDRRWADLVEEGRALIPFYAPEWTDHNIHDPGITLLELFAWLAEMNIFQLNRISDEHQKKFLALIGIYPYPPRPARTVLTFTLQGNDPLPLPANVEFETENRDEAPVRFRTLEAINIVPGQLQAISAKDSGSKNDLTNRLQRGEPISPFGSAPAIGTELYFGFSEPFPLNENVSLYVTLANTGATEEDHARFFSEISERQALCSEVNPCCPDESEANSGTRPASSIHTTIRITWEILVNSGQGKWRALNPNKKEVVDATRSFTFDGYVTIRVPESMKKDADGLHYMRCRFEAGDYDATPLIRSIAFNALRAEQSVPIGETKWIIKKGVTSEGETVSPGMRIGFDVKWNADGDVVELKFVKDKEHPEFLILEYKEATSTESGVLRIEAINAGGSGLPHQTYQLPESPVVLDAVKVFTLENEQTTETRRSQRSDTERKEKELSTYRWHTWQQKRDFDSSGMSDKHFVVEASSGIVRFGDGEKGVVVPKDAVILMTCAGTEAADGNVAAAEIQNITRNLHNEAISGSVDILEQNLAIISNPLPADGGAAEEELAHAKGRALELMQAAARAITLSDYEALARKTPGVHLARVEAHSNTHPGLPCLNAPGVVQVMVVPDLPVPKPRPSKFLLSSVAAYLGRRRMIGTRVEVIGPIYIDVTIKATIQSMNGANKTLLKDRIIHSLNDFFNPLTGGPDGGGWPFGRDIYRSEVLQVIENTDGVQHTVSLEFLLKDGKPKCGNICLPANGLVAAGNHQIELL